MAHTPLMGHRLHASSSADPGIDPIATTVGRASEFEVNTIVDARWKRTFAPSMLGSAKAALVVSEGVFNALSAGFAAGRNDAGAGCGRPWGFDQFPPKKLSRCVCARRAVLIPHPGRDRFGRKGRLTP